MADKKNKVSYLTILEEKDEEKVFQDKEEKKDESEKSSDDIRKDSINLFLTLEERLYNLSLYYSREKEQIGELISSIIGMYFFSKTKNLTDYLKGIATYIDLPLLYRIECCKNLENDEGYPILNGILNSEKNNFSELPTPIRIETILFLMKSDNFMQESLEYFCEILADQKIDNLYRYKTIQVLESRFDHKNSKKGEEYNKKMLEKYIFFAKEASLRFMKNTKNLFTYRVLSGQYLFEKCSISSETLIDEIEEFLLEVASDPSISEDIRADSCDILLQYGREGTRIGARNLLFVIGGGDFSRNNIFKNSQNVHVRAIEDSVQKIVEKLILYYPRNGGKSYDFVTAREEINKKIEEIENKEDRQSVEGALTRIVIDRAVYGSTNMTLSTILSKIWTYIQDSEHRKELERRLIEELIEANNKCSTGYTSRLVNVLSGFDEDMSITISFEDQIIANLEGRLNAKIRQIKDEEEQGGILEEMVIPVIHYHLRPNFLKFFRENISSIREGMFQEFTSFMTDIDYDMYFRKAIIHYEGCS